MCVFVSFFPFLMTISLSHHLLFPQYYLDDRLDEVVTIEFLDDLNRIDRSSFISCLLAPPPPRFAESTGIWVFHCFSVGASESAQKLGSTMIYWEFMINFYVWWFLPHGPEDLQRLRPGGLILAENPVFFLSFGPVLRRLQGLTAGEDHGTLPLASCLLGKAMSAEDARQPLPWSLGAFNHWTTFCYIHPHLGPTEFACSTFILAGGGGFISRYK